MTSNLGLFTHLRPCKQCVKIGDDFRLEVVRIGIVPLLCLLPNNSSSHVTLHECLYIPDFGEISLVSSSKCQEKGLCVLGYDNLQAIRGGSVTRELILYSKFIDGIFEVQLHEEYGMLVSFSN